MSMWFVTHPTPVVVVVVAIPQKYVFKTPPNSFFFSKYSAVVRKSNESALLIFKS